MTNPNPLERTEGGSDKRAKGGQGKQPSLMPHGWNNILQEKSEAQSAVFHLQTLVKLGTHYNMVSESTGYMPSGPA